MHVAVKAPPFVLAHEMIDDVRRLVRADLALTDRLRRSREQLVVDGDRHRVAKCSKPSAKAQRPPATER